jgi:hypothetical protein
MLWLIMIVLLAALVGAYWKRSELGDRASPVLYTLVVLTLVVSVYSLVARSRPPKVKILTDYHLAAGFKLGEAVAAALPAGGKVVVLHTGTAGETIQKVVNAQLEGLKKGFGATPITVVEAGPKTDADTEALYMMEAQVPIELFAKFVNEAPDAKAVVSLLGPPDFGRRAATPLPPLFLLGMIDAPTADDFIRAGLIKAAVCYKDDADWKAEPQRGMSLDEVFNLRYVLRSAPR